MNRGDIIMLAAGSAGVASVTGPILPAQYALHWYCLAGAIMGAIAMSMVPTKEEPTWRQLAGRIIASATFGVALGPWLIRYMGWPIDAETVMGSAAAVGAVSWTCGRMVSMVSAIELIDLVFYIITLGLKGKLPGDRNDRD